ncbi:PorV/PorQ family protein [bacterium]|nr:PorV/PorQ family protein [bacterium]
MKKLIIAIAILSSSFSVTAGNPDRIGQAGATQLNINGFGRSSGWGWSGVSTSRGLESVFNNVGGLAYTEQTEFIFSRTAWLMGSEININTFGFAQNLGGSGVLAVSVMSYDMGDIEITTVDQPDGGIGTYKPRFTNITAAYSRKFTDAISGGITFKVFSEAITNVKAQGMAIDAGILYRAASDKEDKLKGNDISFGVSLKNVGPNARYEGDGLDIKRVDPETGIESTVKQRAESFNLPALINISAAYDMRLDKNDETYFHRLTPALTFTNNAFSSNQFTIGLEYGYKEMFQIRVGHIYENGIYNYADRRTAFTGFAGGFTFEVPVRSGSETTFGLDYSYRHSNPFGGSHTFGVRLNLGSGE